jgi:hypothetical protein
VIPTAIFCLLAGTLLTVTFGPALICVKYPHKFGAWHLVSIKVEQRTCRRCLTAEYRKDAFWQRITSPPEPSTSHIAMTANERFPLREPGTGPIPRLTNGALSHTPAPPVIAGGRHVVLDHE